MSSFESSYLNLLQGVSQQVPRARLPGQLTEQTNMLSDPVTGLRRRPGIQALYAQYSNAPGYSADTDSIFAQFTDIAGSQCHIMVNTKMGEVYIRDVNYTLEKTFQTDYLKATSARAIRAASVGDSLFLANVEVVPQSVTVTSGYAPERRAYFYIKASAFSKGYSVTLKYGVHTETFSYSTPDGTDPSHAAQATTEYIADQLATAIQNWATTWLPSLNFGVARVGSYVYVEVNNHTSGSVLSITSGSGDFYIGTSGAASIRNAADLPASLPTQADGFIVATGPKESPVYFRYDAASQSWVETGAWGSPTGIQDMPVEIYWDGADWVLDESDYEGRYSGDDRTNEAPNFMDWGITGMTAYQGRLVILAGPWVSMSASNKPKRFFRTTVTELLDSDPIHIGSSAASSAAYEYGVPFSKDLLLFSAGYQALIPAGSTALTPRTAQVVVTSTYAADMTASPVAIGRTLVYPAPRSSQFFGVMEMLPSPYTDSQYVSTDATEHLPKYMAGRCRFIVSSSVANMVLFGQTGDKKSLVVHEYSWSGEEKVLRAWHRWTFAHEIAYAYFSGEKINVVCVVEDRYIFVGTIDPRAGAVDSNDMTRPFLDWNTSHKASGGKVTLNPYYAVLLGDIAPRTTQATGDQGGQEIGNTYDKNTQTITMHPSFDPDGDLFVGIGFESSFTPTPPTIHDQNGIPITTNKLTLLRYHVLTQNTQKFDVIVRDTGNRNDPLEYSVTPLKWSSPELALGLAPVSREGSVILPCRTNAPTTVVKLTSDGTGEMNVLGLEYVCRVNPKIQRR